MLKLFFEYRVSKEWLPRNPARLVKDPRGRDAGENRHKLPFSDEELKRMYGASQKYGLTAKFFWTGEDLAHFISISIYSGLRISDVAKFHIDRMNKNGEILVRTMKSGTDVCTRAPGWLQDRIRVRETEHGLSFLDRTGQRHSMGSPICGAERSRTCGRRADHGKPSQRRIGFAILSIAFFCRSRASP